MATSKISPTDADCVVLIVPQGAARSRRLARRSSRSAWRASGTLGSLSRASASS